MQFLPRDPHEIKSLLTGKTFRVDNKDNALVTFTKDVLLTESGTPMPYNVTADGAGAFTFYAPGYAAKSRLKLIKFITQGCTLLLLTWQLGQNGPMWSLTEVPEAGISCALSFHAVSDEGTVPAVRL